MTGRISSAGDCREAAYLNKANSADHFSRYRYLRVG